MEWYVTLSFRLSPDDNRGAWRNLLEVVIADSWLLERGIPRLADTRSEWRWDYVIPSEVEGSLFLCATLAKNDDWRSVQKT